ncbi:uncharacterized protein LOC131311559 [Rhododendron vialii]|uniref:uncharacterized protein LOC131311559 n=1 Tax=Rhododendron vialii TaxID=182163 RepID=UPI00265FD8DC|nr:uncharacterized protein LOC131311559 [Rhododendron vialii]
MVREARGGWQKPCGGFLKINVDGAWKWKTRLVFKPHGCRGISCSNGVELGQNLGLRNVLIEGDSQAVINMINGLAVVNQEVKIIIDGIKVLSRYFASCIFSYRHRSSNSVVHLLASKGLIGLGYSRWTESPPIWLLDPMSRDEVSS